VIFLNTSLASFEVISPEARSLSTFALKLEGNHSLNQNFQKAEPAPVPFLPEAFFIATHT